MNRCIVASLNRYSGTVPARTKIGKGRVIDLTIRRFDDATIQRGNELQFSTSHPV
jgi:hypothetical protein